MIEIRRVIRKQTLKTLSLLPSFHSRPISGAVEREKDRLFL